MKTLLFVIMIILLIFPAQAAEILREISPQQPSVQDPIEIKINLLHDGNQPASYEIEERLPTDIQLLNPPQPTEVRQQDGIKHVAILKWTLEASPQKITSVSYTITATKPGLITFLPVRAIQDDGTVLLGQGNELLVQCKPNNQCEPRENYLNCPQDCSPSAADGICNPKPDNLCDEDCTPGADVDCKATSRSYTWIWYLLGGIILLVIIVFIIRLLKSKEQPPLQQQPQQPQQPQYPQQPQQPQQPQYPSQYPPAQPQQPQDPLAGFPGNRNI